MAKLGDINSQTEMTTPDLAYVEGTAGVSVTGTSAATSNLVIDSGTVTYDGSPIWIAFFAPYLATPATAGAQMVIKLYDGATELGNLTSVSTTAAMQQFIPISTNRRLAPTAGTHNYLLRAMVSSGTGSVAAGPGGPAQPLPMYLRITKA